MTNFYLLIYLCCFLSTLFTCLKACNCIPPPPFFYFLAREYICTGTWGPSATLSVLTTTPDSCAFSKASLWHTQSFSLTEWTKKCQIWNNKFTCCPSRNHFVWKPEQLTPVWHTAVLKHLSCENPPKPSLFSQHSCKVHEEEGGMYHCNPHFSDVDSSARFEVRFSSTQGARLCLAIACIPHSITYSDCTLKCLCNEENWNFLFPPWPDFCE